MADFGPNDGLAGGAAPPARADFFLRLAAAVIDGVLLGVVGFVFRIVFPVAVGALLQLLLGLAYYSYLEGSPSGQTLGKRAMSIRVIDVANAGPIGTGRGLIRYIGRIISAIPCGLGYFWMLWDPEKQTWHDKMAATFVVPTAAYPVAAWPG